MTHSIKMTESQKSILTLAASRPDRAIEPLAIPLMGGAKTATLRSLEQKGWTEISEGKTILSDQGFHAIGLFPPNNDQNKEPPTDGDNTSEPPTEEAKKPEKPEKTKSPSKKSILISMIKRPEGATLNALCKATQWQSHSVRGAISQLKSKGHNIISTKFDGERSYSISAEATDVETSTE